MGQSSKIRELLANGSMKDFSASFDFYDRMIRSLHRNIIIVDHNNFRDEARKFICDMNDQEYKDYLEYLDHLAIAGLNLEEYFYGIV